MAATLTFAYTGRDSSGKVVKGRVDASGEASVVSRLRTMGIAPITIKQVSAGTGLNRDIRQPGQASPHLPADLRQPRTGGRGGRLPRDVARLHREELREGS